MEIRAIVDSEYTESEKIECIAFNFDRDFSKKSSSEDCQNRFGAFENGKMVACLDSFPYSATLNGRQIGMAGIGNVASLPEERRKGHVAALLRYALEQSKKRGDTVSFLFPFSNVYYRRFGYESCMLQNRISIPISSFRTFSIDGTMKMYIPGGNMEEIKEIYRDFASNKNLMLVRSDRAWERILGEDPYQSIRYVYVHRDGNARADGYVILKPKEPELRIEEMCFRNYGALRGMLGFFYHFSGNYNIIRYSAPSFLDFHLIIPEPYDVTSQCIAVGMARVVDVPRALTAMNPPASGEPVSVRVSDDFLEWNNGTFSVRLQDGETRVEPTSRAPDLACDVRTLVQLISGHASLETCAALGNVQVNGRIDILSLAFSRTLPCMYDIF